MDSKYVQHGIGFFKEAHVKQTRNNGTPYFENHLLPVATFVCNNYDALFVDYVLPEWKLTKEDVIVAGLGHDYLEDKKYTNGSIEKLRWAGFSELTIELIRMLTKSEGENYFDFIQRLVSPPCLLHEYRHGAQAIKLADTWHNGTDNPTEGSRQDKYRFAQWVLSDELRRYGNVKLKFPLF
jgi:(p)ppGpp synthase/HD superfamily hydrolase